MGTLTFEPLTSSQQCINVTIIPNNILEGEESFSVQLIPTNEETVIMVPSSTVSIMDQDSKYM